MQQCGEFLEDCVRRKTLQGLHACSLVLLHTQLLGVRSGGEQGERAIPDETRDPWISIGFFFFCVLMYKLWLHIECFQ